MPSKARVRLSSVWRITIKPLMVKAAVFFVIFRFVGCAEDFGTSKPAPLRGAGEARGLKVELVLAVGAGGGEPDAADVGCSATFAMLGDCGAVVIGGGLHASKCRLPFGGVLFCRGDCAGGGGGDICQIRVAGIDCLAEFNVKLGGGLAKAESVIAIPFGAVSAGTGGFG